MISKLYSISTSYIGEWKLPVAILLASAGIELAPNLAAATEHEVEEFGGFLEQCLDEADGAEAKAQCIGAMSQVCMDEQDGGHTTLGMSSCLAAEGLVWDQFLNAEYKVTMDWSKAADEDEAESFPDYANRAKNLRAAQRAWIAFRDAECALEYAQWGSGSMRTIAAADCLMQMTAERSIELLQMREMFE
ncbi:MAG: lysozyme inhibitor LprI family protein [Boseongicola sp.]